MSVYVKLKAFELTRMINDEFPVVEFETEIEEGRRGVMC